MSEVALHLGRILLHSLMGIPVPPKSVVVLRPSFFGENHGHNNTLAK